MSTASFLTDSSQTHIVRTASSTEHYVVKPYWLVNPIGNLRADAGCTMQDIGALTKCCMGKPVVRKGYSTSVPLCSRQD